MLNSLKTRLRDLLPIKYQVPSKYWYGRISGSLEDEMDILCFLVKNADRVIDIGGNRGVYAYRFWALKSAVEVFEPNPICFDVLAAWANDKEAVRLHPVALSNQSGSADLHIPIDENGVEHDASASIEQSGFISARNQSVPLRTLDSYQFMDVALIKIDVEGHEYSVLEGSTATLASSQPAILVEIEQRHNGRPINEVFQKITGLGYRGFFLEGDLLKSLDEFEPNRHQALENFSKRSAYYINNFLFLHQSKIESGIYERLLKSKYFI